jgi:hypothetical protein
MVDLRPLNEDKRSQGSVTLLTRIVVVQTTDVQESMPFDRPVRFSRKIPNEAQAGGPRDLPAQSVVWKPNMNEPNIQEYVECYTFILRSHSFFAEHAHAARASEVQPIREGNALPRPERTEQSGSCSHRDSLSGLASDSDRRQWDILTKPGINTRDSCHSEVIL